VYILNFILDLELGIIEIIHKNKKEELIMENVQEKLIEYFK
jgi:hypothetical protein